ncbi:MAG: FecR family protein [Bacteroidia bacterium]|nr:FecR family protein [Bacteroidia bacterium]
MNNYPDNTFLARWLNGELSEEEIRAFEGTEDHAELERLMKGVDKLAPQPFEGQALLSKIKDAIQQKKARKTRIRRLNFILMAAAASIVILMLAYFVFPFENNGKEEVLAAYEVKMDEKPIAGNFPDGSTFALNKSSKLEYDGAEWGTNRAVKLEGEAYFEVKKGKDFIVNSDKGKVKVLGTKFNVVARDDFFQVECFEGKVEVSGKGFEKKILTAGTWYRPIPQRQIPIDSALRKVPSENTGQEWLLGATKLDSMTLKQIVNEFEKHYDVDIILHDGLENDRGEQVTSIPHESSIPDALKITFGSLYVGRNFNQSLRIDSSDLGKNNNIHIYKK